MQHLDPHAKNRAASFRAYPLAAVNRGGRFRSSVIAAEAVNSLIHAKARQRTQGFDSLFDAARSFIAILEGPHYRFVFANRAYLNVIGNRQILDLDFADALPDAAE